MRNRMHPGTHRKARELHRNWLFFTGTPHVSGGRATQPLPGHSPRGISRGPFFRDFSEIAAVYGGSSNLVNKDLHHKRVGELRSGGAPSALLRTTPQRLRGERGRRACAFDPAMAAQNRSTSFALMATTVSSVRSAAKRYLRWYRPFS